MIELPDDPDAVGFKLGGYSQVFVDAIKATPFVETGGCSAAGGGGVTRWCRQGGAKGGGTGRRKACCLCGWMDRQQCMVAAAGAWTVSRCCWLVGGSTLVCAGGCMCDVYNAHLQVASGTELPDAGV